MYEIDELAGIVAMASDKEQRALTIDISVNGQREPAVLWQDKIVDGRCRQLACDALGIVLKVRHLDGNLSRSEVASIVKSLNVRRNLTTSQKIMSAVKEQEKTGEHNQKVADSWGIGLTTFKNGKYVKKHRPEFVDPLFGGRSVDIRDEEKGYVVTTTKVNTVARLIKKSYEYGNVVVDNSEEVTFTVDGLLKTEASKEWYYSTMASLEASSNNKIQLGMLVLELANLKFKEASSGNNKSDTERL